jgi:hypothetical protein
VTLLALIGACGFGGVILTLAAIAYELEKIAKAIRERVPG